MLNATAATKSSKNCTARRLLKPNRHTAKVSAVAGKNGLDPVRSAALCAGVAIVSCVLTAAPEGVTVLGLNVQLAPLGSPVHAKLTAELNPFAGVTVMVAVPAPPESTVSATGLAAKPKLGGGPIV